MVKLLTGRATDPNQERQGFKGTLNLVFDRAFFHGRRV
jgi:hypothetical protein